MSNLLAESAPAHTMLPTIRDFRSGDESAIVACLRAAFGAPARLERWRHLHLENPAGPSVITVARTDDMVVGQIASLRRRVRFFAAEHAVAHTIDTAIHPTWQHRGLFPTLVEASEHAAERAGLHASYGVANDMARNAAVRYEHRAPLGAFPVMVRPLRPLASLTAMARHHLRRRMEEPGTEISECAASGPAAGPTLDAAGTEGWALPRFDARHTALFDEAEHLPPIAFFRDGPSLAWRYPARPGPYVHRDVVRGGQVTATAVVRMIEASGLRLMLLMEWHWRRGADDDGRALAREVVALARGVDAHGIAAMATRGSAQRRILGGLGFVALPARAFPQKAWPGVHTRPPLAADTRWTNGEHWYFTWGDGLTL